MVDSENLYAYVQGNPVDLIDPSGERGARPPIVGIRKLPRVGPFSKLKPGQLFALSRKEVGIKRLNNNELIMQAIVENEQIYIYTGGMEQLTSSERALKGKELLEAAMSKRREAIFSLAKRQARKIFEGTPKFLGSEKGIEGSEGTQEEGVKATKTDVTVRKLGLLTLQGGGSEGGKSGGVPGGLLSDAPGDTGLQKLWMLLVGIGAALGLLGIVGATRAGGNVIIDHGKFRYLFGQVKSNAHNLQRSLQNLSSLRRIGIHNSETGRKILTDHLTGVARDASSVARTWSKILKDGTVINLEARESLLAGPGGFLKLESTWQIMTDGARRLTTVIPFGG
jgi:filamentous hemagglutinin